MSFDFNNNIPIYVQIIEYIKRQIIIGIYKPNEMLIKVSITLSFLCLSLSFKKKNNVVNIATASAM